MRDTASVPCWLTEYDGELYFLTLQTDVSAPVTPPPWLGHRVLVEGSIAKEPRICGGLVLEPVVLSVLPELDASCNTVLPAEDRYNLTFEPPRPPGPSEGRLAFDPPPGRRRRARHHRRCESSSPMTSMVSSASTISRFLTQALSAARALNARTIEMHRNLLPGERCGCRTDHHEVPGIGKRRAHSPPMLLKGAGLTAPIDPTVQWPGPPAKSTGVDDYLARRVEIAVRR